MWGSDRTSGDLGVPEAIDGVVVDHPCGLHEGVTDGGADKLEAAAPQVPAHGVGFRCVGGDLAEGAPRIHPRFAADVPPEIRVEAAELALDRKERLGVADGG